MAREIAREEKKRTETQKNETTREKRIKDRGFVQK